MKEIRMSFFALIMLLLASCSSNRMNKDEHFYGLNTMLDYYYHHYCNYPSSIEELDNFANLNLYDSSFVDTAKAIIYNLKKNEKAIVWQLDDTFPVSHLYVTINQDTLAARTNDNQFPSLDNFIYSYTDCYGELPSNASGFIDFRKAAFNVTKHMQYWEYDSLTIHNLQKCLDSGILSWLVSEKGLTIKVHDDTISNWSGDNTESGFCQKSPEQAFLFSPRFFNSKGIYVFCEDDLYEGFRHHIRELYGIGTNEANGDSDRWYFLVYTKDEGLEALCGDVDLSKNNTWGKTVSEYVSSFAEENGFSKIIFSCPGFKTNEIADQVRNDG